MKTAIVTGAGTGIGKAVTLALLRNGYKVALAGRRKEPLEAVAASAGGASANALAVPTDGPRSSSASSGPPRRPLSRRGCTTWGR